MKQTDDEKRFYPISAETGRAQAWLDVALQYRLLCNMSDAHRRRLFLFRTEAQGFARAKAIQHNRARFRTASVFLPPQERAQIIAHNDTKARERKHAITALRYARRYGSASSATIARAERAGIRIKPANTIMAYADFRSEITAFMDGRKQTAGTQEAERESAPFSCNRPNAKEASADRAGSAGHTAHTAPAQGIPPVLSVHILPDDSAQD